MNTAGFQLPSQLIVQRYRSFEHEQILPLRPITLLYGRNNAGKSALLRALSLMGASMVDGAQSALVMPRRPVGGAGFETLAWRGDAYDYTLTLGLGWKSGPVQQVRFTLDGGPERPSAVTELHVVDRNGHTTAWSGQMGSDAPLRSHGDGTATEVQFSGLVPTAASPALATLRDHLINLRRRVHWLEGVRKPPRRSILRTGIAPDCLSSSGGDVGELLVERQELLLDVSKFYRELTPSRTLEVRVKAGVEYELMLNPTATSSLAMNLLESGEGMIQVLPVLAIAALASRSDPPDSPPIVAIEEPESHLHPDAQAELARYLCRLVAGTHPPTFVLETHSRAFLLGVQLAVARGELASDRVCVAWIDQDARGGSSITAAGLTAAGQLDSSWPNAALTDDSRLAGEIIRMSMKNGG